MRGIVKIGFGLLLVLLVGGLAVAAVNKVRHAAAVTACGNNLKLVGRGLAWRRIAVSAMSTEDLDREGSSSVGTGSLSALGSGSLDPPPSVRDRE